MPNHDNGRNHSNNQKKKKKNNGREKKKRWGSIQEITHLLCETKVQGLRGTSVTQALRKLKRIILSLFHSLFPTATIGISYSIIQRKRNARWMGRHYCWIEWGVQEAEPALKTFERAQSVTWKSVHKETLDGHLLTGSSGGPWTG